MQKTDQVSGMRRKIQYSARSYTIYGYTTKAQHCGAMLALCKRLAVQDSNKIHSYVNRYTS